MHCYCGSNKNYPACCQPFHLGSKYPPTAEALMRARYSAYAIKDASYIYNTYTKKSQANHSTAEIFQWADQCQWVKLEVNEFCPQVLGANHQATVKFSAYYLIKNDYFLLHELSRFVIENGHWKYADGDIIEHTLISTLKRNDKCPCNSGKKFKQCCQST